MPMMMLHILKSVKCFEITKMQKCSFLKNKTFLLQINKLISYTSRTTLWQKKFFSGGNLYVRSC